MIPLLTSGAVALSVSLLGTRYLIGWLRAERIGQPIHEAVPDGHTDTVGTPTMGGVAIVAAATAGYIAAHPYGGVVFTRSGLLVMFVIASAGMVGVLDDWIKVRYERNLGLSMRVKIGGVLVVAIAFAVSVLAWTDTKTTVSVTRWDQPGWDIGDLAWAVLAVLLIAGTTNAVHLTDGLDGLAAGSAVYAYLAMTFFGFWAFRHPDIYELHHPLDLAIVAAAMAGATTGFLWWNAPPSQVFMGDTGALALGAGLAALSLTLNVALLLPIVGALYLFEALSVIAQVGVSRAFGRRLLRMAPIHHHFELCGWPETTVLIRLWLLALMSTATALAVYYADFISTGPN